LEAAGAGAAGAGAAGAGAAMYCFQLAVSGLQ